MTTVFYTGLKREVARKKAEIELLQEDLKELYKECTHEEVREVGYGRDGWAQFNPIIKVFTECLLCSKRLSEKVETTHYDKD